MEKLLKYEAPKIVDFKNSQASGAPCFNGSGATDFCDTGNVAPGNCWAQGNSAGTVCNTGSSGAA